MSDYDKFENEMQAAGWSLDEIEEMYQAHLLDLEIESDETYHLNSLGPSSPNNR